MSAIPETEIAVLEQTKGDILTMVDGLVVNTPDHCRMAESLVVRIASTIKSVEDRRKFFVSPLNDHIKRINSLFKDLTLPLEAASATVRRVIADFRATERKAAEDAARIARDAEVQAEKERALAEAIKRKAEELHELGNVSAAFVLTAKAEVHAEKAVEHHTAAVAPRAVMPPRSDVSTRKVWKFNVLETWMDLLPREYTEPSLGEIRKAVSAGVREIPGVRIYCDEVAVVRTKT